MEKSDQQLLRQVIAENDQDALAELVRRHVRLVYAAACRKLRDQRRALDAVQAVFVVLRQRADEALHRPVLASWLLDVTYLVAERLPHGTSQHGLQLAGTGEAVA